MVQDVVVEPVRRQDVPTVVGCVEGPVVSQALRAQHEDSVVPELVVLDDRERLEGLPQANRVSDDAPTEPVDLVDRAHHAIALELVELLPHNGVADTCRGVHDLVLTESGLVAEDLLQDSGVDLSGSSVLGELPQESDEVGASVRATGESRPGGIEPVRKLGSLSRRLGCLDHAHRVARGDAEPIGREREGAENPDARF